MHYIRLFFDGLGVFAYIIMGLALWLLVKPLVEQWTDGESWNGEWPFFHPKSKKDSDRKGKL